MDSVLVVEVVVVALAVLVVAGLVIASVVRRRRHGRDEEWQDDPSRGRFRIRPGAGWGNGGSWH